MRDTVAAAVATPGRTHNGRRTAAELLGRSAAIARVHDLLRSAAAAQGGVLITAEPGVASASVARDLHVRGRSWESPFVVVECGNADRASVERLLFGGPCESADADLESVAIDSRIVAARGGTLFLQDVTELPASVQARVARVARDGEARIDGAQVRLDFRLVATAPPGIDAEVHEHRFRADLFRRLATTRIDLPPLRERSEDLPEIAACLLEDVCADRGVSPRTFTDAALGFVAALTWPGNVVELRSVLDRVVSNTHGDVIQVEDVLPELQLHRAPAPFVPDGSLRDARQRFEREYIAAVLQYHGWRVADAAQTLGIQRPNLYRKARQLGIPLMR
jgi:DNA-binding NtrC family response regulator